ncbi:MAG: hypothetical protein KC964_02545, partial [Candidatus Omnitrophica bacterium]|nr:hypothetical protein [Candidatus Omnitrophota bacterium]
YADALKEMGYPIDVPTKQGGDAEKPAADEKPEAKEAPKDQVAKFEGLPPCAVNPGSKVDFTKFFLTEDGPVYFCCGNCCAEFAKDPAKYAEGVKKQREHLATLDKIQVSCPVSGKPVDPNVTKEFDGQTIAFCCTNCCAEYSKDPAKFAKELVGSFTYQTLCPVSDKPIDPSVSFELAAGQKVYFCCGNCCAEFAKDPAKYADKVKEQGYKFDFEAKKEVAKAEAPAPEEKVAKFEGLPPCAVNPGSKVDFTKFFLTEDGPVYFCCGNCCAEFAKDPAKYAEGVEKQRAHLASLTKIQVACPVSGKPVDPNVTKEFDGQTIAFCCTNCCAEYSKDPAKFAKELVGSFTYQTLCPVSGKPIDPTVSFELAAGQRVYFCCGNCCAEFAKDPAKYADKVKEQGYKFDFEAKTKAAKAEEPKSEEKPAEQAKAESEESVELPNCVVNSGGKINLAKFVLTDEGPVYFCCDGCKAKYEADPGKFADSVAEQHKLIAALPKSQVCCPLSGKPCDTQFTAEYDGQKVAFCCGNCCAAFSKDPAAYADKLASAFTLQTVCPVSGKPINPQASLEVSDGVQLYFCCQGCKSEYEKNPEKYKDSLAKQGFQF